MLISPGYAAPLIFRRLYLRTLNLDYSKHTTFEQFVLVPQRTLEGRYCLFSSSQLLALTTAKAGSGRALFWTDPNNTQRGGGQKGWEN